MRIIAVLLIACSIYAARAVEDKTSADAVVVGVLDQPMPSKEAEKFKFLWEQAVFKSGATFDSYTTENWKTNYSTFAKSLVQKAESQKLDAVSLGKVLDLVLADSKDKIAYLPIGAHQTTMDGGVVWIITMHWELVAMGRHVPLGHIRKFAFDQKTLKQVGFVTCN